MVTVCARSQLVVVKVLAWLVTLAVVAAPLVGVTVTDAVGAASRTMVYVVVAPTSVDTDVLLSVTPGGVGLYIGWRAPPFTANMMAAVRVEAGPGAHGARPGRVGDGPARSPARVLVVAVRALHPCILTMVLATPSITTW